MMKKINCGQNNIKILLIGSSAEHGGAERRFYNLSKHLFGGKVEALVLKDPSEMTNKGLENLDSLGWNSEWSYPKIILKIRGKMLKEKYDVVFSLGRFPNLVVWAATRFMKKRPKLIFNENTQPWTSIVKDHQNVKITFQKLLMKQAYKKADLLVSNSVDGIEESVNYFGVSREKSMRVPNIIDSSLLNKKAREDIKFLWPNNKHILAVAARLDRFKRIDTLLDAVSHLPQELDWAVLISGDGPEEKNLRGLVNSLHITERVHFLGWVENPYPIIKRATIFVLCSEYEGFSNSMLEAMFLGTPVITSYCTTDVREICTMGAAMGFEVGKPEELRNVISELINNSQKRLNFAENAKIYCMDHELNRAIRTYENLIINICNLTKD